MVSKNTSSTRCFARKQQLEDLTRHAASVKYKNKEAKKKFLQSLIGLKLNVPEHWWIDSRGNKLWKCVVESINLDDEYRRYFISFHNEIDRKLHRGKRNEVTRRGLQKPLSIYL